MEELAAAIEANPDDVEAYHVYGDWLQQQGDPRGLLIALQAAAHRDPDDKKLARRADRHFAESCDAFLGPLRPLVEDERVSLVWRHGFIRDAHFELFGDELVAALRELVRHPSGRFVESIMLRLTSRHASDEVVGLLLAERRPRTLAELRFHDGLEDADAERLRAVFPRLHRSLDIVWRTIGEAIGEQRKLEVRLDAAALPALEPRPDVETRTLDVAQLLLGLRLELDRGVALGICDALRRTFTTASLEQFATAIGKQHVARSSSATTRWTMRLVARFGGAHAARWIGESIAAWSQFRAEHMVQLLAEIGRGEALIELAGIASDIRLPHPARMEATWALARAAQERGLDVDELLDREMPATLTPRQQAATIRRLHVHMVDGRRIGGRELHRRVMTHPAMAPLAERLVWATYVRDRPATLFRITGERAVDATGATVAIEHAVVGIVHPAELAEETRGEVVEAWREAFDALGIEPLFAQLERPVHAPRDLASYVGSRVDRARLAALLEHERGWETEGYELVVTHWLRRFARGAVIARIACSEGQLASVTIEGSAGRAVDELHPVVRTELIDDLEVATGRQRGTPAVPVDTTIEKGTRVRIVRGEARGTHGLVFWLGDGRCGVRGDDGDTHWANLREVVVEGAPEPEAAPGDDELAFGKGDVVRWVKGRQSGTGTVFWLGPNKFGEGMRVGIKDAASGETIWANAKDCEPAE